MGLALVGGIVATIGVKADKLTETW
jgi:hypothetical protein